MAKFSWLVMTNCEVDRDDEFNRWYDEVHIPDLLLIPGVVGARRSILSDIQLSNKIDQDLATSAADTSIGYLYLAIYEIESEDPSAVLEQVKIRSGTDAMKISPFLVGARAILYENNF